MKKPNRFCVHGFTVVEMLVSITCGSFILAAIVLAGVSLQKSYAALEGYSTAQADQLRVLDYIALDCRRAIAGNVPGSNTNATPYTDTGSFVNGSWAHSNTGNTALILTLPTYYNSPTSSNATFNTPTLTNGKLQYGTVSGGVVTANTDIVTVSYQQTGTNFTREVIVKDSTDTTVRSDVITAIAKNVSSFAVTATNLTNSISCSVMFFPNFLHNTGTGTWRSGKWNPDHAPDNGTGVNGDWYVINNTGNPSTIVGDVYYRSSNQYSKIQNVKATTVAIQTFLRNPSAR